MRVLIVRLGSMGDVLHALPAVAALRVAHPDAHVGWAIERRWTPLLVREGAPLEGPLTTERGLVNFVHVVNTRTWRKAPLSVETWAEGRNVVRDMRAQHYDVAIDFQGAIKSALVAQLSGAATRVGFAQPREKPATMFYTSVVQPRARHIVDQNLELLLPLRTGAPPAVTHSSSHLASFAVNGSSIDDRQSTIGNDVVLPSDPAAESRINGFWDRLPSAGPTKRIAILNPGAGWSAKQWPTDRYAEVARALHQHSIFSLVNYGPSEESLAREVEQKSDGAAHPIFCTLPELIALTRRACLFIGGDTGPMHLAAALGVPVVALFGPTDPTRNGPYIPPSKVENQKSKMALVLRHPASRTDYSHKNEPDPGLLQITADEVIAAARMLLFQSQESSAQRPTTRGPRS